MDNNTHGEHEIGEGMHIFVKEKIIMTDKEKVEMFTDHGADIYGKVVDLLHHTMQLPVDDPIRIQTRILYDYLWDNDYAVFYRKKYGPQPPLCLDGVKIPKSLQNPCDDGYPWFCVIDGKIAREETDKEEEVIDWCFDPAHHHIPEIGAIGYALFEKEPIMKEWIDKAVPYYLADIKNRYKKWKKKRTLWIDELEDCE